MTTKKAAFNLVWRCQRLLWLKVVFFQL